MHGTERGSCRVLTFQPEERVTEWVLGWSEQAQRVISSRIVGGLGTEVVSGDELRASKLVKYEFTRGKELAGIGSSVDQFGFIT